MTARISLAPRGRGADHAVVGEQHRKAVRGEHPQAGGGLRAPRVAVGRPGRVLARRDVEALRVEHPRAVHVVGEIHAPPGEGRDHLAPGMHAGGVVADIEGEVSRRPGGEPGNDARLAGGGAEVHLKECRVGGGDHSRTAPSIIPRMKWRCRNRYNTTTGSATSTAAAASSEVACTCCPLNRARANGAVRYVPEGLITSGMRNSFHVHMKVSSTRVTIAGRPTGTRIRHRICRVLAPSRVAASMSEGGAARK